jgi:transcriptional antiterminator NusG
MAFFAVSTRQGKEISVAESLADTDSPHIHAVLSPDSMNSYIIVEADGLQPVEEAVGSIYNATKVIPGMTSFAEVQSFLTPKSRIEGISEGDVVNITAGAYEGSTAKVNRIDHENETVTVNLTDSPIPIPIDIPGDQIRPQNR